MSETAKLFDYFVSTPEVKTELTDLYAKLFDGATRKDVIDGLQSECDAVAHTLTTNIGNRTPVVDCMIIPFPADTNVAEHIRLVNVTHHNQQRVAVVRGKAGCVKGDKYNKRIDQANELLEKLPTFQSWLVSHLDCYQDATIKLPDGQSQTLESYGGTCDDVMVLAIPKTDETLVIEGFEHVSYDTFYDLTNK